MNISYKPEWPAFDLIHNDKFQAIDTNNVLLPITMKSTLKVHNPRVIILLLKLRARERTEFLSV